MPTLTIMQGIPASGKSTLARERKERMEQDGIEVAIISPDHIREELTGDPANQSRNAEVFPIAYINAATTLFQGRSVIVDATNTTQEQVDAWRAVADVCRATFLVVRVDTALEECLRRNRARDRQVPESVLYRMMAQLRALDEASARASAMDHVFR